MKKYSIISFLIMGMVITGLMAMGAAADAQTTITIGQVTAQAGASIRVPIQVANNKGICGAAISIHYDSRLVLIDVAQGEALSSLFMTRPGSLSENPVKLVWDGMEQDAGTGTIAILTFTAPQAAGSYPISVSYEAGDIVDGSLQPIAVKTVNGQISVTNAAGKTIEVGGSPVILPNTSSPNAHIIAAFYDTAGTMKAVACRPAADVNIKIENTYAAAYAKVMLWDGINTLTPQCIAQTVELQ